MAEKTTKQYTRRININSTLIHTIDNGIVILDTELKIYYYNQWLELYTGIKESSVIDKNLVDFFPDINIKTLKRKIKTALIMGTPTFYTANTSKYLIPIKIDQINISSYSYMQQDISIIPCKKEKNLVAIIITDQTNMANTQALLEEKIKKIRELNQELIKERDTIDRKILLLKINKDYKLTDISHAYLELLGYTKDELLYLDFFDYERLHIKEDLKADIIKYIDEKKVFKFEEKTLSSSGKIFWMQNTLVPEYDTYGNHLGSIIFRDNITDSKELLMHQKKLLVNSRSSAMGEMISMIAHQWRQPLSLIMTIISTLKIKKELNILNDIIVEDSYSKIEETIHYLSSTIDDFRDYFKKNKLLNKVTLAVIFEKSTTLLKESMKIQEIEYVQNIDTSLQLETLQNELIQSVINIIKNSIDAFIDNDCENKKIAVLAIETQTHISISITDNAGGIKQDIIQKIFEPYFSTKSKNGTGLGLYMCKTIIEEHLKGKLTIISYDDITEVLIELPYKINQKEEK